MSIARGRYCHSVRVPWGRIGLGLDGIRLGVSTISVLDPWDWYELGGQLVLVARRVPLLEWPSEPPRGGCTLMGGCGGESVGPPGRGGIQS